MSGFEQAAVHFLQGYGYAALFVLLALETAMILHFVPSEIIVTAAAAALATDITGLLLVIAVSTLGATTGSLLLYAFARHGGRRFLEKHGRHFGFDENRRVRLESWFRRPAGESLVFFLRLLPFFRAAVSIPAGLAKMDVRRFTLYSAAGSLVFNAALAYPTYAVRTNPAVIAQMRAAMEYATSRWLFFLVLAFVALVAGYLLYRRRRAYQRAPHLAVRHVLKASAIAAVSAGAILLGFSLWAPRASYRAVTWVAVDASELARQYHVLPLLFLLGVAFGAMTLGLIALSLSPFLEGLTRAISGRLRR